MTASRPLPTIDENLSVCQIAEMSDSYDLCDTPASLRYIDDIGDEYHFCAPHGLPFVTNICERRCTR